MTTAGASEPLFPATLAGLADVDIVNPLNDDILVYDGTTGKWYNSPTIPVTAGVDSVNGVAGVVVLTSPNSTLTIAASTPDVTLDIDLSNPNTWLGLQTYSPAGGTGTIAFLGATVQGAGPTNGQALVYNSGTGYWAPATISAGVSSLNTLTGALSVTSPDSSIGVTASSPDIEIEVAAVANGVLTGPVVTGLATETAAGITLTAAGTGVGTYHYTPSVTLGGDLSGSSLGAASVAKLQTYTLTLSSPSSNQVIAWNGSAWVNAPVPAAAGVTSLNTLTGALSITSPNSTLSVSTSTPDVTVDIDLATANTWTGKQTHDSGALAVLNPAATHAYTILGAAIAAAHNLTLPLITANDTLAALGTVQSFTALQSFIATGGTDGVLVSNSASAAAVVNQGVEVIEVASPLTFAGVTYGVSAGTNSPAFGGFAARGTLASPAAVQAGDLLISLKAGGYNGTAWFTGAKGAFRIYAGETWSTSASGTYLSFYTTTNGTTTSAERMRVTGTGQLGIGTTTPNAAALLDLESTTQGLLPPQMTTVQKAAIGSPPAGLALFDSTLEALGVYNGSSWQSLAMLGVAQNWTAVQGMTLYTFNSNTAWGTGALAANVVPQAYNTAFGAGAMASLGAGNGGGNSAFGYNALGGLGHMTSGGGDAFGEGAGQALTTGSVTAFGAAAGAALTSGITNTAIGQAALATETTGQENVGVGWFALEYQKGASQNVAVGTSSGRFNQSGIGNVSMGHDSFHNGTSGSSGNGSYNVVIGWTAMQYDATVTLSGNVVVGASALNQYADTSNGNSVAIGYKAGYSIVTGSQNVILGYFADAIPSGSSGMLNIANWIFGTGLFGTGSTLSTGAMIGIGTMTPAYTLDVVGGIHASAGLYGELDTADLDGKPFSFATLNAGDVLTYNGSDWVNSPGPGITVFDTNTSLTGSNTYGNVIVTDGATLTLSLSSTTQISGTLTINPGCTVTMNGATLVAQTLANAGALTSTSGSDSLSFQNSALNGTASIAGTMYLLAGSHSVSTGISGAGVTNLAAGATLSVPAGTTPTLSVATLSGTGTLAVFGGLTLGANYSFGTSNITMTGTGTLAVSVGATMTVVTNQTWGFSSISGAGTVSFPSALSSILLTANCSWKLANISVGAGKSGVVACNTPFYLSIDGAVAIGGSATGLFYFGDAGTGLLAGTGALTFSIPSFVNFTGSNTYTGAVTVTGAGIVVAWLDARLTRSTSSSGTLTLPITVTGTGCLVMFPATTNTATASITITNGSTITAGTPTGSATGSGHPMLVFGGSASWTPSSIGSYYLGFYDSTATTYALWFYAYFGGTGAFVLNHILTALSDSVADTGTDTIQVYLSSASAGNITIGAANQVFKV